jgi:F1F0 ATPase subunit 2
MNETIYIILIFICGIILGIIFFGGLWFTVKKVVTSKIPGLLFIISFIFRTGIVLLGFYYLAAGNFKNMIACLIGFIIARFIIKQSTKSEKKYVIGKEASNET